jgi:hypothetical protein
VITALHIFQVPPVDVPEWLRSPVLDEFGNELKGIKKVDFLLEDQDANGKTPLVRPGQFDTLLAERLKLPAITIKPEGDLANVTGCALLLVHSDQNEMKVLSVITNESLVRKTGLKNLRETLQKTDVQGD